MAADFWPEVAGSAGDITVTANDTAFSITAPGWPLSTNVKRGDHLHVAGLVAIVDTVDVSTGTFRHPWTGSTVTTDEFTFQRFARGWWDQIEQGAEINAGISRLNSFTPDNIWAHDSGTGDADPGPGKVRFNHGTFASINKVWFDDLDIDGNSQVAWIGEFDRSATPGHKALLRFRSLDEHGTEAVFRVTGDVVDKTGYQEVPVAPLVAHGTLSGLLSVSVAQAGAPGSSNAVLDAIAAAAWAADKGLYSTGVDTFGVYTLTSYGRGLGGVADEAAFKALVNLEIGVDVQGFDATLEALKGLNATAGVLEQTGADAFTKRALGVGASTSIPTRADADARYVLTSTKGVAGGVADLDGGGKVPTSQLPALAISETFVVASQAAQLALTAQQGDVAIRTDLNKSYIHNGGTAASMADWNELLTPTDTVLSVNGATGAVTLTTAHITEGANLYHTTERVQDVVGAFFADSTTINVTYDDVANSFTADVLDDSISNSKLANMVTGTVKARLTALTGDPEDVTLDVFTLALSPMVGATSLDPGEIGLVPLPDAGDQDSVLFGDGTWRVPSGGGDVVGPGSSVVGNLALFANTSGGVLSDAGIGLSGLVRVGSGQAEASIAAAATVNALGAASERVVVTGSGASITSLGTGTLRFRIIRFTGSNTLVNGASLVLPGGVNMTVGAGDIIFVVSDATSVARVMAAPRTVASVAFQTFTASGTYVPNVKMLFCWLEGVGGGGGGGGAVGSATTYRGAGGGAGGAWAFAQKTAAQIGVSAAVTIGAAGAGGAGANNGGTGGDTSVGAHVVAKGGPGGAYNNNSVSWGQGTNPAAAASSTGDIVIPGGPGRPGHRNMDSNGTNYFSTSGQGGDSRYGHGGLGTVFNTGGGGGWGYGAGGGGANAFNSSQTGGVATAGLVRITEFLSA